MIIKINSHCVSDTIHQGEALLAAKQLETATGQSCFVVRAPNRTFCVLTQGQMNCLRLPDTYYILYPAQTEDRTDDWKYEVANGDTKLGYNEWLQHQKEMQSDE